MLRERHGRCRGGARVAALLTAVSVLALAPPVVRAQRAPVILSTTTSTQDSGLLDVLVPMFERQSGQTVKTIAVGTGQALALGARGEADVVLAHAPDLEKKYVADGKMLGRRLVMYNDFVIIGPAEDPAKVKGMKTATAAMKAVASTGSRFVSRGDNSGTHLLEKKLWKLAGIESHGSWYIESGQGMGATLGIADERKAYTLTDRGTYLAFQKRVRLPILLEGDKPLLNIYSVMEVNPANGARVNAAGGKAFADFMVSAETQRVIKTFGVEKFGQALFVPIAGMKEEDVGGRE
jgi:tungstate transport system substrate-binding protein